MHDMPPQRSMTHGLRAPDPECVMTPSASAHIGSCLWSVESNVVLTFDCELFMA